MMHSSVVSPYLPVKSGLIQIGFLGRSLKAQMRGQQFCIRIYGSDAKKHAVIWDKSAEE